MDADDPQTRSSSTASPPPLRLHDPDRIAQPVTVRFPQLRSRDDRVETPSQAKVVLGTTQRSKDEIERVRSGELIVLDQSEDEPFALIWEDKVVAWVELAVVDDETVWRVVELASRELPEAP